jgi:hypothetical protein
MLIRQGLVCHKNHKMVYLDVSKWRTYLHFSFDYLFLFHPLLPRNCGFGLCFLITASVALRILSSIYCGFLC